MRKEVKRSMIIWPLVASTSIIGMSSLETLGTSFVARKFSAQSITDIAIQSWQRLPNKDRAEDVLASVDVPERDFPVEQQLLIAPPGESGVEVLERVDYGSRAMQLPQRIAALSGIDQDERFNSTFTVDIPPDIVAITSPFPLVDSINQKNLEWYELSIDASRIVVPTSPRTSVLPESIETLAKVVPRSENAPYAIDDLFADSLDRTDAAADAPSSSENSDGTSEVAENVSEPDGDEIEIFGPAQLIADARQRSLVELSQPASDSTDQYADFAIAPRTEPKLEVKLHPTANMAGWPVTLTLNEQLHGLAASSERGEIEARTLIASIDRSSDDSVNINDTKAAWAQQVAETLTKLQSLDRLGNATAGSLIMQLDSLSVSGMQSAEDLIDDQSRVQWLCAAYAVARRSAVWRPVWEVASGSAVIDAAADTPSRRVVAIDYADLLNELERQETDSPESSSVEIMNAMNSLRVSENRNLTNIAAAIDAHYRNANLRVAITSEMLDRLLPTIEPKSLPIQTRVLGTRVSGRSRVESDLELALNPSPDRWSLRLRTLGNVKTNSVGYNGPVAMQTYGQARFVAATPIDVTPRGIQVGDPIVDVNGNTNLRGVQSKYDGLPLISSLVRNIAVSRYEQIAPQSNRIANQKMRVQIAETIDQAIEARVADATSRLSQAVLGPLGRLHLEPKVIEMQTTHDRLLARYRLAGEHQLAAFTPRPRAPRESLLSAQIHQSAINNMLEQLIPTGEEETVHDTIVEAMSVLGAGDVQSPEDLPDDVTVQFAKERPITVEIADNLFWVTMRVVQLNRGEKMRLNQFIVRAAYQPEIDGLNVSLVRTGHLRISGTGMSMRERLPVRAIFNKVLSPNRKIPLTLPVLTEHVAVKDLAITQLELRDGWIGLAVGHHDAPKLALAASALSNQQSVAGQTSPASSQR